MEQNKLGVSREEFSKLEERVRNIEVDNKLFVYQYKDIKETLGVIKQDIDELKETDGQNWRRTKSVILDKALTGVLGAIMGGILALIIK